MHYENAHKTAEYLRDRSDSEGCSSLASELKGASRQERESVNLPKGKGSNGIVDK